MSDDHTPGHPGALVFGGIVIIDEPKFCGVTTFADNGEVLLTFNMREGADIGQIIIGLSPNMAMELLKRLQANSDFCAAAINAGRGGNGFSEEKR